MAHKYFYQCRTLLLPILYDVILNCQNVKINCNQLSSIMETINSAPPSSNLIHPELNTQVLTPLVYNSLTFNVNIQEYDQKYSIVLLMWSVLVALGVATPLNFLDLSLKTDIFFFMCALATVFILISILVFYNRRHLPPIVKAWTILTSISLVAITIIIAKKLSFMGPTISIYVCIQLLCSFCLVKNKGVLLIKLIGYIQLILIGFKRDGYLSTSWAQILYGVVVVFIFLCILSFLLSIYIIAGSFFVEKSLCRIKRQGLLFYLIALIYCCCIVSPLLWYHFISDNYLPSLIVATSFYWVSIFFVFKSMIGITLFVCHEVYQLDQKAETPQISLCDENTITSLYQISSNWMTTKKDSNPIQQTIEMGDCIACMSCKSDATYMPCGHCSLCLECSRTLLIKSTQCPLCKKEATHILKLRKEDIGNKKSRMEVQKSFSVRYRQ